MVHKNKNSKSQYIPNIWSFETNIKNAQSIERMGEQNEKESMQMVIQKLKMELQNTKSMKWNIKEKILGFHLLLQ